MQYFPVCSGLLNTFVNHSGSFPNVAWWLDNSPVKHNKLLVSAYYGLKTPNYREVIQAPDDVIVLGDSGGFQMVTQKKINPYEFDPIKVLRWQENNCDEGIILDLPPYSLGDYEGATFRFKLNENEWLRRMEKTSLNAEAMIEKRDKKSLKLFGVIQGDTWKELEMWFKQLTRNHEFDGYCMAPKPPSDPYKVAKNLLFANEMGIKNRLHVLQVTGKATMAVVAHAQNRMKIPISFDSSSHTMGARIRSYMLPFMQGEFMFGDIGTVIKKLPCNCPVCSKVKTVDELYKQGSKSAIGMIISLHNLYTINQMAELYEQLALSKKDFQSFMKSHSYTRSVMGAVEFLDYGFEHGAEKALIKYSSFIKSRLLYKRSPKQKLMDF